ncbi:methyl-accepting chemotaxis protein [Paenibacillus amylolyticus]|uniref:Methyl-accepting chemotaxis protein n=1 Tax=Paenibacillus amylolyticus TaxID=1451 RepID=A0AAP5LR94_PAEAM|nr:HAMP domain-containing protein [Paenibacillus amylolyticus]MDR6724204.1 methyl-accepting chemotaxis protein [Paenibacillus amylolyticus]
MNSLLRTVRSRYIYICGASALLSVVLLFVVYQMLRFVLTHLSAGGTSWLPQLIRWGIHNIGTRPIVIVVGAVLFLTFFWIRSQKITDDLQRISQMTHALANGETGSRVDVLSGGELRQIAAQLNEIAFQMEQDRMNGGEMESEDDWSKKQIVSNEYTTSVQVHAVEVDLPVKLTIYSILSSLETIIEGRCQGEAEIQHWVRLTYQKTLSLQQALDVAALHQQVSKGD